MLEDKVWLAVAVHIHPELDWARLSLGSLCGGQVLPLQTGGKRHFFMDLALSIVMLKSTSDSSQYAEVAALRCFKVQCHRMTPIEKVLWIISQ